MRKPVIEFDEIFLKRCEKAGIDINQDRWSAGIPHREESELLVRELMAIDWIAFGDYFGWKYGGDGDSGETLAYQLDVIFELREKEAKAAAVDDHIIGHCSACKNTIVKDVPNWAACSCTSREWPIENPACPWPNSWNMLDKSL